MLPARLRPPSKRNGTPSRAATSRYGIAFAVFTVLGRAFPRGRRWFLLLACGVAASRVLVGEHFLSDVVAGAGMGYVSSRAVLAVPRFRRLVAPAS